MIDINDFIKVQESRQNHDDEAVKKAVNEYDEALER
jgi:tetratricopeptide repeat protein 30